MASVLATTGDEEEVTDDPEGVTVSAHLRGINNLLEWIRVTHPLRSLSGLMLRNIDSRQR